MRSSVPSRFQAKLFPRDTASKCSNQRQYDNKNSLLLYEKKVSVSIQWNQFVLFELGIQLLYFLICLEEENYTKRNLLNFLL